MRVYVGTFGEKEANEVVEDLRKSGIRSELRHSLKIDIKQKYYVEGNLNELKEKYKEGKIGKVIKNIENYFEKARELIKDGIDTKEFEEAFLNSVLPERKEFEEIRKDFKENMDEKGIEGLIKKYGKEKVNDFFDEEMYEIKFMPFIHSLLKENGIEYKDGKMYGKVAENPHVKVYVDGEISLPYETKVYISKYVDVYANLMDIIYETDRLEKIVKEKPLYLPLLFASITIAKIMNEMENKMELEQLIKKAKYFKQNGDEIYLTDEAINEIIKTLEKGEIIRVKKGKIVLKERRGVKK